MRPSGRMTPKRKVATMKRAIGKFIVLRLIRRHKRHG
jgi:hypothetical protein